MALHQKPIKYQDLSDRLAPYAYWINWNQGAALPAPLCRLNRWCACHLLITLIGVYQPLITFNICYILFFAVYIYGQKRGGFVAVIVAVVHDMHGFHEGVAGCVGVNTIALVVYFYGAR